MACTVKDTHTSIHACFLSLHYDATLYIILTLLTVKNWACLKNVNAIMLLVVPT